MAVIESTLELLDAVFGSDSQGTTIEQRAATSKRMFVRGQTQVAFDNPQAKGHRLTAQEALETFGWSTLSSLSYRQASAFLVSKEEPGNTISNRRNELGLSEEHLARAAGVTAEDIRRLESGKFKLPFSMIEKIAQFLALDETQLGLQVGANGDPSLGVRLRELYSNLDRDVRTFSPTLVAGLSEAAWVIRKQGELQKKLSPGISTKRFGFTPSNDFRYPAYRVGQELAHKARQLLKFGQGEPIRGLKDIVERRLSIPVVQSDLPPRFAGATLANGANRGIALNTQGPNENVWVRRNTLAHELGHLLWDPVERLNKLIVDDYGALDTDPFSMERKDPVEIRANAFAVEFLAPQQASCSVFNKYSDPVDGLEAVMSTYGISFTAAKWQVANGLGVDPRSFGVCRVDIQPDDEWKAGESFTADYFPIDIPVSRRGRFARQLIEAHEKGWISEDTVAMSLLCTPDEFREHASAIKSIFD